jgi:DNA-binding transcriptional regulator GbsR (MarR family)
VSDEVTAPSGLNDVEQQVISFCRDGVRVLGLPKSVGEIYGLLFISPEPLSLDDLVLRLGISKGSASQGLKFLRELAAVTEVDGIDARRTYFEADVDLKKLVGGFIREEVRPHLKSGESKLKDLIESTDGEDDEEMKEFYQNRINRLNGWTKQARLLLPLLQRVLGE